MQRPFFAVLGGMGTLATESFVRLVNENTNAHCDQEFLDYVVFNDASVPDRTAYIVGESSENPFPVIADDIRKANAIGASFIVLTCNTAHYFYDDFQELSDVPLLHMPRLAVETVAHQYGTAANKRQIRVGLFATDGSLQSGVYQREIGDAGFTCVTPDSALQSEVMSLIYDDVKSGTLNRNHYVSVLQQAFDSAGSMRCDTLILGCTELSVLNEAFPMTDDPDVSLVDAQAELVLETVRRAQQLHG